MSTSTLFRVAGYSAIVTLVLWIGGFAIGAVSPALVGPALALAAIIFLVVIYALYLVHRTESSGLALGATLLTALGMIVSLFAGDPSVPTNAFFYGTCTVVFGVGIVLLAWLAFNSPKMPRGLAIAVLIMGIMSLVAGVFYLGGAGMLDIANLLNFGSIIPSIVWMLWLGRLFLSGKMATA